MDNAQLQKDLTASFGDKLIACEIGIDMVTAQIDRADLLSVAGEIKDNATFVFDMLIDVCGVDYLDYGIVDWRTHDASSTGFSRGQHTDKTLRVKPWDKPRFAVVYHFLSIKHNHRLRLKVFLNEDDLLLPSVNDIWPAANWFEREVFDLFGIQFEGHPDLRRLLTDYGFKGHPFRKDFPLIGKVEMRYDAAQQRCVYEPVSIQPRVNIPKVIREDNRYVPTPEAEAK
jgi:NADH-quinone oxidoreductase subunit C